VNQLEEQIMDTNKLDRVGDEHYFEKPPEKPSPPDIQMVKDGSCGGYLPLIAVLLGFAGAAIWAIFL
jgi:hypothetical protein